MIYLNHAGTSWPKPPSVSATVNEAMTSSPSQWDETLAAHHRAVASYFGFADNPDALLLSPGCTSALNVGILDHAWESGDRIFISAMEHHALHRAVYQLEKIGVDVVVIPRTASAPIDLDFAESEFRKAAPKMVAVSAAANVTGEILPLRMLCRMSHAYGSLLFVDGAQLAGWQQLDVAAMEIDLFAFAGHKALQGPWGIGGLMVAQHVQMQTLAAACSIDRASAARPCGSMPNGCDVGSVDRIALAGLVEGLRLLPHADAEDRLRRGRVLVKRLEETLRQSPRVTVHGHGERIPTVAISVDGLSPEQFCASLRERGVVASAGFQCSPLSHEALGTAVDGVTRMSVGPFTEDDDVTIARDAIMDVFTATPFG